MDDKLEADFVREKRYAKSNEEIEKMSTTNLSTDMRRAKNSQSLSKMKKCAIGYRDDTLDLPPLLCLKIQRALKSQKISHDLGIKAGFDWNNSAVTQIDNNTSNMALENSSKNCDPRKYYIANNESMQPLYRTNEDTDGINEKNQCQIEEIDQPGSSLSSDVTDLSCVKNETLSSSIGMAVPIFFPSTENRMGLMNFNTSWKFSLLEKRSMGLIFDACLRNSRRQRLRRPQNVYEVPSARRMCFAAATNNVEMLERLLNNGVSPNSSDALGRTPLHIASGRGYTEIVRLLLKYGADATCRDSVGNTPLHLAAVTSKISVITLLLEAGTDPLSADNYGYNPLQLAESKLRILQSCKGEDMLRIKAEVSEVVSMLVACLKNRQGFGQEVESLSNVCSRLTLSNTTDQVQDEVRDLLSNIASLSLKS